MKPLDSATTNDTHFENLLEVISAKYMPFEGKLQTEQLPHFPNGKAYEAAEATGQQATEKAD